MDAAFAEKDQTLQNGVSPQAQIKNANHTNTLNSTNQSMTPRNVNNGNGKLSVISKSHSKQSKEVDRTSNLQQIAANQREIRNNSQLSITSSNLGMHVVNQGPKNKMN